jgi:hypothetical protein
MRGNAADSVRECALNKRTVHSQTNVVQDVGGNCCRRSGLVFIQPCTRSADHCACRRCMHCVRVRPHNAAESCCCCHPRHFALRPYGLRWMHIGQRSEFCNRSVSFTPPHPPPRNPARRLGSDFASLTRRFFSGTSLAAGRIAGSGSSSLLWSASSAAAP